MVRAEVLGVCGEDTLVPQLCRIRELFAVKQGPHACGVHRVRGHDDARQRKMDA